jgi:hypothetical protein
MCFVQRHETLDPKERGRTPIFESVEKGQVKVAERLGQTRFSLGFLQQRWWENHRKTYFLSLGK